MILEEFEVDQETAERDIKGFLGALLEHEMVLES